MAAVVLTNIGLSIIEVDAEASLQTCRNGTKPEVQCGDLVNLHAQKSVSELKKALEPPLHKFMVCPQPS